MCVRVCTRVCVCVCARVASEGYYIGTCIHSLSLYQVYSPLSALKELTSPCLSSLLCSSSASSALGLTEKGEYPITYEGKEGK